MNNSLKKIKTINNSLKKIKTINNKFIYEIIQKY